MLPNHGTKLQSFTLLSLLCVALFGGDAARYLPGRQVTHTVPFSAWLGKKDSATPALLPFGIGAVRKKQDGAHEPECKHVRKATYVQMTLL